MGTCSRNYYYIIKRQMRNLIYNIWIREMYSIVVVDRNGSFEIPRQYRESSSQRSAFFRTNPPSPVIYVRVSVVLNYSCSRNGYPDSQVSKSSSYRKYIFFSGVRTRCLGIIYVIISYLIPRWLLIVILFRTRGTDYWMRTTGRNDDRT